MRVLFFTQQIDASDAVLGFTVDWVRALAARVESLHCLALEVGEVPELPENVSLHSLGKERGRGRFGLVVESQRKLSVLLGRVDVVLAHMAPVYAILSCPLAAIRGVPVFTWYTHEKVSLSLWLATAVSRRVFTAAPESFRLRTDKLLVMGHGIAMERFEEASGRESSASEVVAVGRLSPIKRTEVLLEAAALLKERGRPLRFRIVGDAGTEANRPYVEALRRQAEARGLGDSVVFEGRIPFRDVPSRYGGALAGVSACAANFDKVVLECMATATPSLTANLAFASLLGEDADLLLFEDAAGLSDRLERLAAMAPAERRELGRRLRERVGREHGLSSLMDRLVATMASEL